MNRLLAAGIILVTPLLAFAPVGAQTESQTEGQAQNKPAVEFQPSTCAAIAQGFPGAIYAALTPISLSAYQVAITYAGHSTYVIETPGGVTIATDYAGFAGQVIPRAVTMNRAHSTHYTDYPDPAIEHVLRGWTEDGSPASHNTVIDDLLVRNVTTDIVRGEFRIADANSIFIFEAAGLCIGHLGHLHHNLTDDHYAKIGRLDVVMVPIDGAMTLTLNGMSEIVSRLRSSIILPMHAQGWARPADLITMLGDGFDHKYMDSRTLTLTLNDLPKRPTVMVPRGL
ncbi:MAG TPA: MBL fold metallo-hydrolase [Afifellaceae bacterium]|nr:MBL fold metallo-hydrolase [Afifellaceae bacterium]